MGMEALISRRLEVRSGAEQEINAILSGSRQVWGMGITQEDYVEYHRLVRHHPWSEKNFQHLVLGDELGDIFSSCKLYLHQIKADGQLYRVGSIGAVFTPSVYRSKGYARQMLEHLLDRLREDGYDLAMLFSDIGTEFYARFNFRVVRKYDPVYAFLNGKRERAQVMIYEFLPPELLDWHLRYAAGQRFSLVRSPDYFQLLSDRITWHRRYMGFREQRVIVSREDSSYLWVDLSRWRIILRDFGTASPNPAHALSGLLSGLRAKHGFKELGGWLPNDFDNYSFLQLKEKRLRSKTVLMISALSKKAEAVFKLPDDQIHFWLADYF